MEILSKSIEIHLQKSFTLPLFPKKSFFGPFPALRRSQKLIFGYVSGNVIRLIFFIKKKISMMGLFFSPKIDFPSLRVLVLVQLQSRIFPAFSEVSLDPGKSIKFIRIFPLDGSFSQVRKSQKLSFRYVLLQSIYFYFFRKLIFFRRFFLNRNF